MGISFADGIDTLSRKKIEGWVWKIPGGKALPEGLIFNVRDIDHPLLNVSRVMSVLDMTVRLTQLAEMVVPCDVKIDRTGRVTEKFPGALSRIAQ